MSLKWKQKQIRQKEDFERQLQTRLSFLSGKGIESAKADKDTIVRKLKAGLKAANSRLRQIAENEKRTAEMARIKAERAAAPPKEKEKERGKAEKPKKAPAEGKEKKAKAEKKATPPKDQAGGKSQKPAPSPEEGKAPEKKKPE